MDTLINNFIELISKEYSVNCGTSAMQNDMFHTQLRASCESNTCANYGLCHTCPPNIGSAEDCIKRVKEYKMFIAFNKVYTLDDSFDFEDMVRGKQDFNKVVIGIAKIAKKTFNNPLVLGAGGCGVCDECAARSNLPCRFPSKAIASLEAHCIQVSQYAEYSSLKYINGNNTVTYFGGVFLK